MDCKNGKLKNVDIFFKIGSLLCSWVKRLYSESFHEWKIIPLYFIESVFGKNFKFHSNLDFKNSTLNYFPSYYHKVFTNWKSFFSTSPIVISRILNKCMWYNRYIKIDNDAVFFDKFPGKGINFLM